MGVFVASLTIPPTANLSWDENAILPLEVKIKTNKIDTTFENDEDPTIFVPRRSWNSVSANKRKM